jgi:hypothetical protein
MISSEILLLIKVLKSYARLFLMVFTFLNSEHCPQLPGEFPGKAPTPPNYDFARETGHFLLNRVLHSFTN